MIIGTAGHIDHGKTALVRALTGVDTDRLPEEKRRGITIDLGFAPLELPGVGRAGVVDVPGHEAFVRTMLAGATGVDLALLVVAADEGVMPQTREHVAILSLLGVGAGVVALTKCDLVEEEWLELVRLDLAEALAGTPLDGAPVVPTSTVTGAGLSDLRDALAAAMTRTSARDPDDLFRMPIDRVFTIRGTGTVVTGTVWSGTLRRDATVRILPDGRAARVRGLQAHGAPIDAGGPGSRLAVALAGVEHDSLSRGAVLAADAGWAPSRVLRADVALADGVELRLSPRAAVRLHLGTSEVGARVVTAGGALVSGDRRAARIVLDAPIVARGGDRFVFRGGSPLTTLGGGVIVDPAPEHRRPRPWTGPHEEPEQRLGLIVLEAGGNGVDARSLSVRLGVSPAAVEALLAAGGANETLVRLGDRIFASSHHAALGDALRAKLDRYHSEHPLDPGAALQSVRSQLPGRAELVDDVLRRGAERGEVVAEGGLLRRAGWRPTLTPEQAALKRALAERLEGAAAEPPSVVELAEAHGSAVSALLRILDREGVVVQVESERYYAASAVEALVDQLRRGMEPGREYSPAELRDIIGISRKYLIPFLEYCDRQSITERRPGGRVLHGMSLAMVREVPRVT